ncbi:MAG: MaoC family dehydratase N-terminal domain-containing protein [Deferribacteres bacterium]|nr:MaoC family dehydratase N-terminal domain-containing protein [Deferribacteres bacterium]
MEISSKFVGTQLKEYKKIVNWHETMNYAAAVNDTNPHYFDDERETGIIAPPMFATAATWPILQNFHKYIKVSDFPFEVLNQQVHYREYLQFHNPVKPGDELRINGTIAAILPRKAGTHIIIKFEATNQTGRHLFTEYIGGMLRGVICADNGEGEDALPKIPSPPEELTNVWEQKIKIEPLLPFIYDACSNIVFPIHTSQKFAHAVGLPGIILQGTATLALAVREIVNRHADGNPLKLQSLSCNFSGMVFPDSEIRVQLLSINKEANEQHLFFHVLDENGHIVIKNGYASIGQ